MRLAKLHCLRQARWQIILRELLVRWSALPPRRHSMLRRSLGRALAAGLRSRHASFAAASALARCAVGARTCLALLLVAGYAAPQKLALCLQLPQPKLRERKLGKKERLNIVLVGKTGHGKSSLANILCGDKSKFPVSDDLSR